MKLCLPRAALVAALILSLGGALHAAELRLRILQTTDLHMNLLGYDYYQDKATDQYGLARTATLIRAARAESPNNLLFDNGDLLQGGPMGDYVARVRPLGEGEVHPAYQVMNRLGYDGANIGNHDFNYGLDFLRRAQQGASFPYVNANVYVDDADKDSERARHAFTPYVLLQRSFTDAQGRAQTLKIGVIGFTPPQIMLWDRNNLQGKVVVRDVIETANRYVPQMRAQGAQLVIAIAHSGFSRTPVGPYAENTVEPLARVAGVDAVLFGHSHGEFPGPAFADYPGVDLPRGTIHGVPAVMPGRWGDHLGVIDLTLDNGSGSWRVSDSRASLRPVFDRAANRSLAAADPEVEQLLAQAHAGTLAFVRNKVAFSSAPIYSYFAQVADDPSVQIVSNAQLAYLKRAVQGTEYEQYPVLSAAAPFKTGGRQGWSYYTDIAAGPLAIKDVSSLYVYPNTLKGMLLSGAEVREWLEMSAGQFRQIDPQGPAQQALLNPSFRSYNFDAIDGLSYAFDVTQPARYDELGKLVAPAAHRVVNLRYQGLPVQPEQKFLVATNNYRAFGGGNFPGLTAAKVVIDTSEEVRQVLVEYLRMMDKLSANKQVNPSADGNWAIVPVPGVRLTFESASDAQRYLPNHPQLRLRKDNGDGSAQYEIVAEEKATAP